MDYRTEEQYQTIIENMENGNWTDAAKKCVEFGFYAQDLINAYEKYNEYIYLEDKFDFATLIEMATELRFKRKGN